MVAKLTPNRRMKILDISGFVKKHVKKFVFIGGWILAAALLYIRPPIPQESNENERAAANWARLVLEDQRYLKIVGNNTKGRIQRAKERLDEYDAQLEGFRQKTSAYSFMLNSYEERDDVFEIMLCCRQISSVKAEYETVKGQVGRLQDIILRTNALNRVIQSLEEEKARQVTPALVAAIDQNIAERRANLEYIVSLQPPLREFADKLTRVGSLVDELYDRSNKKRDVALQDMFLTRNMDLKRAWSSFVRYMPLWQIKISGWWRTQIPLTAEFWLRFLVLLSLIASLLMYIKVRWVKPFLLRSSLLSDDPGTFGLFSFGYWLLIIAVVFLVSVLSGWLSAGAANVFIQLFQAFFSTGILLLSMLMRNTTSHETRGVMRFVMPVIVQHLICAALYITLVSRIPLLVILPLINFFVAVWLVKCLMSGRHDTFTLCMGALTIVQTLISIWMALSGFVYFAFTMTLGWQVLVAQVLLTVVLTLNIYHVISNGAIHRLRNVVLKRLVLPLLWVALVVSLFVWLTQTYHLQDYFIELFRRPLPMTEVAVITFNRVLLIFLLALFLQFAVKFVSEHVQMRVRCQDESNGALYASALTIGRYLSWSCFAIVVCVICQINAKSMLVMLGGFGLGLGLALKGIAENFFSGITLLVGQEIRPGDLVEIGSGQFATVQKITFWRTIVETNDGAIVTYPNAVVTSKEFRNWTRNDKYRRYDIPVDVAYGTDLTVVRGLLLQAISEQSDVDRSYARQPIAFILGFQDSAIRFIVRVWIPMPLYADVSTQLQMRIYTILAQNNISIPFPQMDVHMKLPPQ
jgi:small-conductance mechanosensitive channel